MKLYHGTNVQFHSIDLSKSKTNKDFGCGFYLSDNYEQAEEMASFKAFTNGGEQCVMCFDFDSSCMTDGSVNVKTFDRYTLDWAEFILANRKNDSRIPFHPYDIVYGPIANDRVGTQIRRLENGDIDITEFMNRLKYMKGVTFQYFFGTEKALKYLKKI